MSLSPAAASKLATFQKSAANARSKIKDVEHALVRKSVIALSAAGVSMASKKGVLPDDVMGVPTKLAGSLVATLVEATSRGSVRRMAGGVADSLLAIYTHEAIQEGSFVAGGDLP